MSPEFSGVPCGADLTACHCPNSRAIADFFNQMGKDRFIRQAFNKNGFDKVDPQIVRLLVLDPKASYPTAAFDYARYPFSPELKGALRNLILRRFHALMYFTLETDPGNIHCPVLKRFIADHHYDPAMYLQFKREHPPRPSSK